MRSDNFENLNIENKIGLKVNSKAKYRQILHKVWYFIYI